MHVLACNVLQQMKDITIKYSNRDVTVVWKPNVCIHSAICFNGLPEVFDPTINPWIKTEGSTTDKIIAQVKKCPSGALTYIMNKEENITDSITAESIIEISKDGPILVYGNITIKKHDGTEEKKSKVTALCRCGGSQNKPYCDGSHRKNGFVG